MHSDVCYDHEKLEFHVSCMFMCTDVSGDARGQECRAPPTTTGPHVVEHPTGDTRYGKHVYILHEYPAHITSPPYTVQTPCQLSANLLIGVDLGFSQGDLIYDF